MKPLDSIVFDTSGFAAQDQRDNVRIWRTASGDGIGLYFFPVPPDIDADIDSVDEVRAFYRRVIQAAGGGAIEIERLEVDGCKAIRTIFKIPQSSSMAYLGSFDTAIQRLQLCNKDPVHRPRRLRYSRSDSVGRLAEIRSCYAR